MRDHIISIFHVPKRLLIELGGEMITLSIRYLLFSKHVCITGRVLKCFTHEVWRILLLLVASIYIA